MSTPELGSTLAAALADKSKKPIFTNIEKAVLEVTLVESIDHLSRHPALKTGSDEAKRNFAMAIKAREELIKKIKAL